MFYVSFDCTTWFDEHSPYADLGCDRIKCSAQFNSLDDALTWLSFYHDKWHDDGDASHRNWFIRGIYRGKRTRLNLTPMDYIHSDLTWAEIDALPVSCDSWD